MLPSIGQLSGDLAVNPTTIVKAYSELQHEGVIELQHGKGVFLTEASRRMTALERIAAPAVHVQPGAARHKKTEAFPVLVELALEPSLPEPVLV
jgi:GntR family transcriptional regulator